MTKSWPSKELDYHPTNLFLSLKSVMQRLGPTKKRKRKCSECVKCFGRWTVFIRWTESGLCTRDGWLVDDPPQRSQFRPTNLFLSLKSVMQRPGPTKKKEKEMQWVCQVFRPLDCLYTLNREWTLYKRLVTKSWPTKESDCHHQNSSLVLNLWCKDLVLQKRGKGNAVCVECFGHWTVFIRWTESGLWTRD